MSFFLAEKLDLTLSKRSSSPEKKFYKDENDDVKLQTEEVLHKLDRYESNKEVEIIQKKLFEIKGRINEIFNNADIFPEIEEIDDEPEDQQSKETISDGRSQPFKINSHEAEIKSQSEIFETLLHVFDSTAKERDDLMKEIWEGLLTIEGSLGNNSDASLFNKNMQQREKEAAKSFKDTMLIVSKLMEDFRKLQEMTMLVFEGDKFSVSKTRFTSVTNTQLQEKLAESNELLDKIQDDESRVAVLKQFYQPSKFPSDVATLKNEIQNGFGGERRILLEMTENWQEVCREVRETLIIAHENKLLKRLAKLRLRKALFFHKKIVELLGMRSAEVKSKEELVTQMKSNVGLLTNKAEYLNNELSNSKKNIKILERKNNNAYKDKKELELKIENLTDEVIKKDKAIDDWEFRLDEQRITAAAKLASKLEGMVDQEQLFEEMAKVKKLKEIEKQQEALLGELDQEVKNLQLKLEEEMATKKEVDVESQDQIVSLEEKLKDSNSEIDSLKQLVKKVKSTLSLRTLQLTEKDKELSLTKTELQRKEELIQNLYSSKLDLDVALQKHADTPSSIFQKSLTSYRSSVITVDKQTQSSSRFQIDYSTSKLFDQNERESEKLFLTSSDQLSAIDWESKSEKKFNSDLSVVQEVSVKKEVSPMTFMEKTMSSKYSDAEAEKFLKEKNELLLDKKILEDMIRDLENKNEHELELLRHQMQQEHLIECEKMATDISTMYGEILRFETVANRFRNRIADLFEMNRMSAAAKAALASYGYSSPMTPEDHKDSALIASKKFQSGFDFLYDSVQTAINTAVNAFRNMKTNLEEKEKEKISRLTKTIENKQANIKSLEDKLKSFELLNKKLQKHRDDLLEEIKSLEKLQENNIQEKKKLLKKIESLYVEIEIEKSRGIDKKEIKELRKANKNLEAFIDEANDKNFKQKKEFAEKLENFARTKANEKYLMELLFHEQNRSNNNQNRVEQFQQSTKIENASSRYFEPTKVLSESKILPNSKCGQFVQFLEKIYSSPKIFHNSKLCDAHLMKRLKAVINSWRNFTSLRFAVLVMKYLKYSKYRNTIEKTRNEILEFQESSTTTNNPAVASVNCIDKKLSQEDYQKEPIKDETKDLKSWYWKLQSQINTLLNLKTTFVPLNHKELISRNIKDASRTVLHLAKKGLQKKKKHSSSNFALFQDAQNIVRNLEELLDEDSDSNSSEDDAPFEARMKVDEKGKVSRWRQASRVKVIQEQAEPSDMSDIANHLPLHISMSETFIYEPPEKSKDHHARKISDTPRFSRHTIPFSRSNRMGRYESPDPPFSVTPINCERNMKEKNPWRENDHYARKGKETVVESLSSVTYSYSLNRTHSPEKQHTLPKLMELDVRQDLRLVRKTLQKNLKNSNESVAVEVSPRLRRDSTSEEAVQKIKEQLRIRGGFKPNKYSRFKEEQAIDVERATDELVSKLKTRFVNGLKKAEASRNPSRIESKSINKGSVLKENSKTEADELSNHSFSSEISFQTNDEDFLAIPRSHDGTLSDRSFDASFEKD